MSPRKTRQNRFLKAAGVIAILALLLIPTLFPARAAGGPVLVTAVFYDGYVVSGTTELEEALQLMNVSGTTQDISGWGIDDNEATTTFPAGTSLAPGERIWLTYDAVAFRELFGFQADFEYGNDSDPGVPNMLGSAPRFANSGDEVVLLDNLGAVMDALVYEAGVTSQTGWSGAAVQPYNVFPMNDSAQLIFRRLDEATGYPIADTDTAADWGPDKTLGSNLYGPVDEGDITGKKVMAPGWDLGIYGGENSSPTDYWVPFKVTEASNVEILVAPDNIYDAYIAEINGATTSIDIEGYTFMHRDIAEAVAARAAAGVTVRVLLEGEPCCGNAPDQEELWVAQTIVTAGGSVYFMENDTSTASAPKDRYNFQHAKFTIVDGTTLLTGSENLNCGSMPDDNKTNGTTGNRGTYIKTDAASVVGYYASVYALDLDPANHKDIVPYGYSSKYTWDGITVPPVCSDSDGTSYPIQKPAPLSLSGTFGYEVVLAPENALRISDSLIGMVFHAGAGDVVLVEQAYERKFWGLSTSTTDDDPNPRLEAYIEAARRGAMVRIVFDAEFDDPAGTRDNTATVAYVNGIASSEGLNLAATLVDCSGCLGPAGAGIHNKMVAVYDVDGNNAWVHIGSINGSENSSKFNREMALQFQSVDAFCYLYDIFNYDWQYAGGSDLGVGCGGGGPTPTPTATFTPTPTFTPTATSTPGNTEMHVEAINMAVVSEGGPWYHAEATVTILDGNGQPVEGATVSGTFSGDSGGSTNGVTNANGLTTLISPRARNGANWTFCVDNVSKSGYTYNSAANVETCDSTGGGQATATPTPTPTATTNPNGMHVGDLDASSTSQGGSWTALVTITMHDASHNAVANATVFGNWSGGASGSDSCVTNGSGQCTIQISGIPKKNGSATFTVTNVTHATLTYQSGANHDPDGDSDGTSIVVNKP